MCHAYDIFLNKGCDLKKKTPIKISLCLCATRSNERSKKMKSQEIKMLTIYNRNHTKTQR